MRTKKTLTRREILVLLQQNRAILTKYKVKRIGLFGSYAVGKQRKRSDIDFLVEFKEPTFDNLINLVDDLQKLFGKKVEVLTQGALENIRVKEVADDIKRNVIYV